MAQLEHITPEQIEQYGVVAAPDRLTGKARDNKMIFDRLVRELVAVVVNAIIDKTNELLTAEDIREENEKNRVAAELLRVEAEKLRVQAESARVTAENERVQAEATRVSAELLRVQAENLRVSAENDRVSSEAEREQAEKDRESATNGIVAQAAIQANNAAKSASNAAASASAAKDSEENAGFKSSESARHSAESKLWAMGEVEEFSYPACLLEPGETKKTDDPQFLKDVFYEVSGTRQFDGSPTVALDPLQCQFSGTMTYEGVVLKNDPDGGIVYENTSESLKYAISIRRLFVRPDFMSAKDWAGEAEQSVDAVEETAQNARGSASAAAKSAVDAQHWAIGGTVTYTYQTVNVTLSKPVALSDNKPLQDGASYTADIHLVVNRVIDWQPDPQNPDVSIPIYGFVDVPLSGTGTYDQRAGALVIVMVRIQQMQGYLEYSLTTGNYGGDQIVDCEVTLHGEIAWDEGISAKEWAENAEAASESADNSARDAFVSKSDSVLYSTKAAVEAQQAESWAVGGTGTRPGEDTNNARYWAEQAEQAAQGGGSGSDGATFTPAVSSDGMISWTNDKGLDNPDPVNIMGPKGEKGDPGEPGQDGKSAYEIALEQGYTGTEAEFNSALATLGDLNSLLDAINGEKVWIPGLPAVTEKDNGKVLGVENGVWGPVEVEASGGGGEYTPLPLIVDFTLSEEASLITISQDKEGNPLNLKEFAVLTMFYGGSGNVERSEAILYYNNVSTAVGRTNLGIVVGAAGKTLNYSFYGKKLEYGTFMAYGDGYNIFSPNGINAIRYIDSGEQDATSKFPTITALSFLISGESKTFGVGSIIRIFGR